MAREILSLATSTWATPKTTGSGPSGCGIHSDGRGVLSPHVAGVRVSKGHTDSAEAGFFSRGSPHCGRGANRAVKVLLAAGPDVHHTAKAVTAALGTRHLAAATPLLTARHHTLGHVGTPKDGDTRK